MCYDDNTTESQEKQVYVPTAEELIIAMLLGDGYTAFGRLNHMLEFTHCVKQIGYAEWKLELLRKYVDPTANSRIQVIKSSGVVRIRVRTKSLPLITQICKKLYINRIKTLSQEILNRITPLGLAIWYMDDGHATWQYKLRGKPVRNPRIITFEIANHCFSLEENYLVKEWLKSKYNVDVNIVTNWHNWSKPSYFIRAYSKGEIIKFFEIISPFVRQVPCMRYKIGE